MSENMTFKKLVQKNKLLEKEFLDLGKEINTLREQLNLSESILSATPQLLVLKDQDSIYRAANPAFCEFVGKAEKDIIGKTDFDLFPRSEAELYRSDDRKVLETGKPQVRDEEATGEGGKRWLQVAKTPLKDKNVEITSILWSAVDITERKEQLERKERLNHLNEALLDLKSLNEKLNLITDAIVEIFKADFARIWMIKPGDLCDAECQHSKVTEGPHICRYRERCLHLVASSGRYTHLNGGHRRVPFGCYKIGRVAAKEESKFLTNDVTNDPRIHDHEWARRRGLVSFAGYRLLSADNEVVGVLALFSKHLISPEEVVQHEGLAGTTAQIIQSTKAEEALRDSETRYRETVELLPSIVCEYDLDGLITYVNNYGLEIFGYTPKDIENGLHAIQLIPSDEIYKYKDRFTSVRKGLKVEPAEYRLKCKNGSTIDIIANTAPIYKDGKIIGSRSSITPITELKKIEKALRESEKRYRLLAENVTDVIWTRDMNLDLTYISPSIEKQQGYTVEEAKNRKLEEYLPPDSLKIINDVLREELELEKSEQKDMSRFRTVEVEVICKDGSTIWTEAQMSFIRDQMGNPTGIIGITRDITERKQVEDRLRRERERLSVILDGNPIYIFMIDQDHRVVFWNRAFETFSMIPREQALNKTLSESLSQLYPKKTPSILADLILKMTDEELLNRYNGKIRKTGFGESFEATTSVWPGGQKRSLNIIATRIRDHHGRIIGAIQCAQDVTDNKRLQDQLLRSQKMESLGTLAGGIAHDFNNILSSVIGFAELSLDDAKKGTSQNENIREILIAGNRARDLVKQILTFSRQVDQEKKPIQIKPIVKETLKLIRASIPSTIDIREDIQGNPLVVGDPTQIHQVLLNLCTNAAHAMEHDGGVLTVSLSNVELDTAFVFKHPDLKPGPYINLTVSDTGCGMSSAVQKKIFDPFYTTKEKEQGTGMGLSVVHGIVHSHGGDIYVYSEPGKGSTFKIYLPAIESRLKLEEREQISIPTGTERILFIDDEPTIVNMVTQTLESLGYRVTSRTSSIEALELFKVQNKNLDLVITDMTMPHMTGENLAKELIRVRPDIPVILCTGFSAKIDENKAMAMGIRAFVSKPVLKQELAETIRRVLDNK